jgi:serine/threonine-protein kinase
MLDPDDLAAAPPPGSIFAEKYRIDRVLGVGGMGFVLAARHVQLDERVAIKMLLPKLARSGEAVERFLREGRAAVRIKSEHVGRVLDVGSIGSTHFIVMEYLDGTDLAGLIAARGRLPQHEAVDLVLQACEAVAEAHALGIVHRDLKPANLFLVHRADGSPCVKVLDFGISKMSGPEGTASLSMTKTSSMMGSPLYMSPEQLKSAKNVDGRSDLWAIGVILFELLAGRPPFVAQTLPELGALVLSGRAPDVRTYAPEIAPGLAEAIATCLRVAVEERFPSVAELAFEISGFGTGSAAASSASIARVLQKLPRPTSSWARLPKGATTSQNQALVKTELPEDPALASTELGSAPTAAVSGPNVALRTGGSWGSATDPTPAPKPSRAPRVALAGGAVVALALVGVFGVRSLRDRATPVTSAAEPQPSAQQDAPPPSGFTTRVPSATTTASQLEPAPSAIASVPSASHVPAHHPPTPPLRPSATASAAPLPSAPPSAVVAPATTTTASTTFSHNSKE